MKYLKRYIWAIAWVAYCTFMIFYFIPRQKEFYLDSDRDIFSDASNRFLLFLEGSVLLFLIIRLSLTVKDPGIFRRVGMILKRSIAITIVLALFFMWFHRDTAALGLYINRQISRGHVQRTYVVGYFDGDTTRASDVLLRDMASKDLEISDTLSRSAYRIRPHTGDTLQVDFKKGLFGVAYIDRLTFRKKLPGQ
jgi:hypothetical protein